MLYYVSIVYKHVLITVKMAGPTTHNIIPVNMMGSNTAVT